MDYSALSFLSEYPILLWGLVLVIVALALSAHLAKQSAKVQNDARRSQPTSSLIRVIARRSDALTASEAIRQAYVRNQHIHRAQYQPAEIESIATSGGKIDIPFGPTHSLLWAAETHGSSIFEELSEVAMKIGRADMAAVILKGCDIADRALAPDAVGDSDHPTHKKLEADAEAIKHHFNSLGGVDAFKQDLETYLEKNYPWQP